MAVYDIIEGQTATIDFQLLESGAPIDVTNVTVALLLEDNHGNTISSPGAISSPDPANGHVSLTPTNSTVFNSQNGPYLARWELTDSLGRVSYCPTTIRDVWNIINA